MKATVNIDFEILFVICTVRVFYPSVLLQPLEADLVWTNYKH